MPVLSIWPIPAFLIWAGTWAVYTLLSAWVGSSLWPMVVACTIGIVFSVLGTTRARQIAMALGFPLSWLLSGVGSVPPWSWLIPLVLALLIYPLHSWRDAPFFPTPLNALRELPSHAALGKGALILDAGSGLGDGLKALRLAYPEAIFWGIEASWPLQILSTLRCPWARIMRGNIWLEDWSSCQMLYLFQRPETMARAVAKAEQELKAGAWLISLEFEATELKPKAVVQASAERPVWLYQQPFNRANPSAGGRSGYSVSSCNVDRDK